MQSSEIKLSLQSIGQILLAPETSGYRRRMLNEDVEEFILEEALACPRKNEIVLSIYLPHTESARALEVENAIVRHFKYLREKSEKKLKRTLRLGWRSLFIGFAFFVLMYILTGIGDEILPEGGFAKTIRESLVILGWVAMWRPADLLLYEWYPFKREARLFGRLTHGKVRILSEAK